MGGILAVSWRYMGGSLIMRNYLKILVLFGLSTILCIGDAQSMNPNIAQQLAPSGKLYAAIYTGNFLLVTGKSADGSPEGVSPDMAKAIADRLGVPLVLKPYKTQNEAVNAAASGECGIVLVGSDPARADKIEFAPAYVEIEATYLVPKDSPLQNFNQVDSPGVKIAVFGVSAYGLWMQRNIKNAQLISAPGLDASLELFMQDKLDALAGLRPGLTTYLQKYPNYRMLDGHFMTVQQAIATKKGNDLGAQFLVEFVSQAKSTGLVEKLINKYGVQGRLNVAP
jgi:polar amino acid transport system substrate-binding protein